MEDNWKPDLPTEEELQAWLREARRLPRLNHAYSIWQRRVEILAHAIREAYTMSEATRQELYEHLAERTRERDEARAAVQDALGWWLLQSDVRPDTVMRFFNWAEAKWPWMKSEVKGDKF